MNELQPKARVQAARVIQEKVARPVLGRAIVFRGVVGRLERHHQMLAATSTDPLIEKGNRLLRGTFGMYGRWLDQSIAHLHRSLEPLNQDQPSSE